MIDILVFLTLIAYVPPSPCEQDLAFKPVHPFHLHYLWKTSDESGFTPFRSCVPSGAKYVLRVKEI